MEMELESNCWNLNCAVCCTSNPEDFDLGTYGEKGEGVIDRSTTHTKCIAILNNFCQQFLPSHRRKICFDDSRGRGGEDLCCTCFSQLNSLIETRTAVNSVESRVQSLQLRILEELKELQENLDVLGRKLKQVEDSAKKGEDNQQGSLTLNNFGTNEEDDQLLLFRRELLNLNSADVLDFESGLSKRFSFSASSAKQNRGGKKNLRQNWQNEQNIEYDHSQEDLSPGPADNGDNDECDWNDDIIDDFIPYSPPTSPRNKSKPSLSSSSLVQRRTSDRKNKARFSSSPRPLKSILKPKSAKVEKSETIKRGRGRPRSQPVLIDENDDDEDYIQNSRDIEVDPISSETEEPPIEIIYIDEEGNRLNENAEMEIENKPSSSMRRDRKRRSTSLKSLDKIRRIMSESAYDDDDDRDCADDDDYQPEIIIPETDPLNNEEQEEEVVVLNAQPGPSSSISQSNSGNAQVKNKKKGKNESHRNIMPMDDLLQGVNLEEMSPFKRYATLSLLTQMVVIPDERSLRGLDSSSAEYYLKKLEHDRKRIYFKYDAAAEGGGMINLDGIFVQIDEEAHTMNCSACPYKAAVTWPPPQPEPNARSTSPVVLDSRIRKMMKAHILGHHLLNHSCPLCNDGCMHNCFNYEVHLKTHLDLHPHNCGICGRPFKTQSVLLDHLETHKSVEEKLEEAKKRKEEQMLNPNTELNFEDFPQTFQCHQCPKNFATRKFLHNHEKTHVDREERPHSFCDNCGRYILKNYFYEHRRRYCHPERKSIQTKTCSACNRIFKSIKSLNRHFKRMHSINVQTRPYICDLCGKGFKVIIDMRNHRQTHSEETPWKCEVCLREFAVKRNLARHKCRGVSEENRKKKKRKKIVKAEEEVSREPAPVEVVKTDDISNVINFLIS